MLILKLEKGAMPKRHGIILPLESVSKKNLMYNLMEGFSKILRFA
jgi:hypothetical protein